ncbi:MAG: DUF695 domain-containing protein [Pseudomonadota bacterium]
MSEHWEFYQCAMGDKRAFIFYDEGVAETIGAAPQKKALKIRLAIKQPTDEGMPPQAEFDALCNLEDALTDAVQRLDGIYVGRITVDGFRYFHCFCDAPERAIADMTSSLAEDTGYDLRALMEDDAAKSAYWDDLYPTEDDRQVMQNMKVLAALAENGDVHDIERPIDHWAYFPSRLAAETMRQWLESDRYQITQCGENAESDWPYVVKFRHVAPIGLVDLSNRTIAFARRANGLDGYYDGWETSVETGEA